MPWCPECKIEYREGIDKCSDCGHDLVDEPEHDGPEQDQKCREAFLTTAAGNIEADMIEAILKDNGIPVLRRYREAGGYLMVFMGGTIYDIDLYVPVKLLDKATDVLNTSRSASADVLFPDNVEQGDSEGDPDEKAGQDDSDEER